MPNRARRPPDAPPLTDADVAAIRRDVARRVRRIGRWPRTVDELAKLLADAAARPSSSDAGKNPAAVALGRLGGLKGGKARAAKLSPAQRAAIAKKAARARWRLPR